ALIAAGLATGLPFLVRAWVLWRAGAHVYRQVSEVPPRRVAVVFGAAVYEGDILSPMLRERVETAADLYRAGKVQKILMSGDNRFAHYNEPAAMIKYALSLGLPEKALAPDYAGRRTYDTCYRTRHIFGLEEAILVTQGFHLPRAVYTCRALGVDAVGLVADRERYHPLVVVWYEAREILATLMAWWDVHVRRPVPVLGDPIPL
ncbi:MAG: YdcF family protein, partial [Anaerolineae bacterium]|nr:YdcF family protein [Anaerolineae bacterium]